MKDDELSRSIKESATEALSGWEFTPALQQRVLDRIHAEDDRFAAPRSQRKTVASLVRPLAWVAVAAATAGIVLNTGLWRNLGGAGSKSAPSAAAHPPAAGSSPANSRAKSVESAAPPSAQPAPATSAASAPRDGKAPAGVAESVADTAGAPVARADAGATDPSPAAAKPMGILAAPSTAQAMTVELTLPAADGPVVVSGSAKAYSLAAVPTTMALETVLGAGRVVELDSDGIHVLDRTGTSGWSRQLSGITPKSLVSTAEDGRVAVSAGSMVYLFSGSGNLEQSLSLGAAPTALVLDGGGRLAVAVDGKVLVYEGSTVRWQAAGIGASAMAYGPDAVLVVAGSDGATPKLTVYDRTGSVLWTDSPDVESGTLAFGPDGSVVVAGRQAYDRTGHRLWQLPWEPVGAVSLGQGEIMAWTNHAAAIVQALTGQEIWRAVWNGSGSGLVRAAVSVDGTTLALAGDTGSGGAVWLLDRDGHLLRSVRLAAAPADIAFVDHQLLVLTPQGVETLPES